jgi:hypothetical protein
MTFISSISPSHIQNNASTSSLDLIYTSWKNFAETAAAGRQLCTTDISSFIAGHDISHPEMERPNIPPHERDLNRSRARTKNWIRFLTVLSDQAPDMQMYHHPTPVQNSKDPDAYLSDPQRNPLSWMQLNPRLSRSYLLPSSHASASPHQNHRVHEGLKAYGVGRRLCITKRGYLALIPAETQVGDGVALFKGATFPYVLRKSVDERFRGAANVLVGEAFIPGLVTHSQVGERNAKVLAREEWKIGLEGWIWIC